ncbi:MAG: hypothetical protein DRP93_04400 [Candidatus Neomarinimicrobiota bacterium]|nr:MAG: hypothetical protein DRP93_04400 [Candidatus Neomarinimicrobiota bacterium]
MEGPAGDYDISRGVNDAALYSQMNSDNGTSYASQEFPDFGNSRLQSADDFIVPTGGWDIERVEVLSPGNGDPTSTFIVEIFADNAGIPGVLLHSQIGLPFTEINQLFSIPLTSPIQLAEGHYWISVMIDQSFSPYGQWYWQPHAGSQINNEFANQDPDQLLGGTWPVTWGSGSSTIGGRVSYDFCFALYGPPPIPISNWAIYFGIFLIGLFVIFRFRRRLA